MTADEILAAKRLYPDQIVFKLLRGDASRFVVIPKVHAKSCSKLLPGWTLGALHGTTLNLNGAGNVTHT